MLLSGTLQHNVSISKLSEITSCAWLAVRFWQGEYVAFGVTLQRHKLKRVAGVVLPELETRHISDVHGDRLKKHLVMHH